MKVYLADNLMIVHALDTFGRRIVTPEVAPPRRTPARTCAVRKMRPLDRRPAYKDVEPIETTAGRT
jgi:hypothetical protein